MSRPATLLERIRDIVFVPLQAKQGVHFDPGQVDMASLREMGPEEIEVRNSPEMELFRACVRIGDKDARASILDDLAQYHGMTPEQALDRCLHWEQWSVEEWSAADRTTSEGLQDFYDTVQSWAFDLIWYAYQQCENYGFPASVVSLRFAKQRCPGGAHLDFGSGVGLTSQLFARGGMRTTMADVSGSLLKFARWRQARRGDEIEQINLSREELPSAAFDIVTAVDTLVHVSDFDGSLAALHRALKPSGWLLANFDVRQKGAAESAWHLHDNLVLLEHWMVKGGFIREPTSDYMQPVWRRLEKGGAEHRAALAKSARELPFRRSWAVASRVRWPTPGRIARVAKRLAGG